MITFLKGFLRKKKIVSILLTLILLMVAAGTWVYVSKFWQPQSAEAAFKVDIASGGYSAVAIHPGDGFARLIYHTGSNVYFVRCTNDLCTTNVATQIPITPSSTHGSHQGLVLDSNGYGRITFRGVSDNSLRYIKCPNADCTGATAISLDNIGATPPSIVLDSSGNPRIAYPNLPSGAVKLAVCSNADCASPAPTLQTVVTDSVQDPKVRLDPTTGYPRIVYFDGTTGDLNYITCSSVDCSTVNSLVALDTTNTTGQYPSMVLSTDPATLGRPMISYQYGTGVDLKYVFCGNTECSSGNSITTIESTNNVGQFTSIAIGTDHFPRISYTDTTNSTIRFVRCLDAACSSTSTPQVVESGITTGFPSGLVLDSNNYGRLTYVNNLNMVRFATCLDLNCTNQPPTAPTTLFSNISTTGAASGSANPTNLSIKAVSFSAINNDPDGDDVNKYRLQIDDNSDFSSLVYDSGAAGTPLPSNTSNGFRSTSIGIPYTQFTAGTTYYWRVAFYDTTGNAGAFSTETATFTVANTTTPTTRRYDVQQSLSAGTHASIAMGLDGFPRIAYHLASSNLDLYYARCLDAICNVNIPTALDTTGTQGFYTSIAVASDGFARISYQDVTNGDLKFIQCTNDSCSTKVTTSVDTIGVVGLYTSMVLGSDGFARIVYMDDTGDQLKFVQCTNASCSTKTGPTAIANIGALTPVNTTITAGTQAAFYPSLSLTSGGLPVISYFDSTTGVRGLKLVRCGDAACTSGNSTVTTDNTNTDVGHYSSLALDSNNCENISYYDNTNKDLKFARYAWNGSSCDSSPTISTLDSTGDVGQYSSIKIDASGYPRVAYYDFTNQNVKYNRCTTSTCSSPAPTPVIVAGAANSSGTFTKMILGNVSPYANDDAARIVYFNSTTADGEMALCYSATCAANQAPSATTLLRANTQSPGTQDPNCDSPATCANQTNLSSSSLAFSAVHTDPDSDPATQAQVQLSIFPDFNSIAFDSGLVGASATHGSRSGDVAYAPAITQDRTYFWRMRFSDGVAGTYNSNTIPYNLIRPSGGTTPIKTVLDAVGTVGTYPSVAIGSDGFARITYTDASNSDLKFIRCLNTSCSNYTTSMLYGTAIPTGTFTSIALSTTSGTIDYPRIAFYDNNASRLNVIICTNLDCTSSSPVVINPLAAQGISMVLGTDGLPRIAAYDAINLSLRLIRCTNATCTTHVNTSIDTGNVGQFPSLALTTSSMPGGADLPRISYYDAGTNLNLKYVKCGDTDCSSGNTITTIDSTGNVGTDTSIGLKSSGNPVISYYDTTNTNLKVVACGNDSCSSGNTISVVESTNVIGQATSLKMGSDDKASISYYGLTAAVVKLARCTSLDCSTTQINTVESSVGSSTSYTALALTTGNIPRVAYYSPTGGNLNFAQCTNEYCGAAPNFAPNAPTTLYVNTATNGAQSGLTDTDPARLTFNTTNLRFSALYDDPEGDSANLCDIQIADNAGFSPVYTTASSGAISLADNARTADISANGYLREGTLYYWRIRCRDTNNNQGAYSSSATFQINTQLAPETTSLGSVGTYSGEGKFLDHGMRVGTKYIAYYDATIQDTKYFRCTNTTCTTTTAQTIDTTGDVGKHIAVSKTDDGVDDGINIFYYDATGGDLEVSSCVDGDTCASRVAGTTASTNDVGQYPAVTLVDGWPSVAYYDVTNGDLKYFDCNGEQCNSLQTSVTVDSTGDVGKYASITSTTSTSPVYIAYYDATNGDLKYAYCSTNTCSTPAIVTIDSTGDVGKYASIDLGADGFPKIAYYDATNGNLKLARCSDATCSSPTILTLASTGDVGQYASLKKDPIDGFLRVAYYDATNADLKYIQCTNATCTTKSTNTIDSTGDVGKYVSMDIDSYIVSPTTYDTYPSFAYYDDTNDTLKFAKCSNDACGTPVTNTAPSAPTTPYSNTTTNGAQSGVATPATLGSTSVVFSAIHNDPDGDAANKYRLEIDDTSNFSSKLYDSENTGLVGTSMTSTADGARSPNIAILAHGGAVTNLFSGGVPSTNIPYYWRITFWDVNNAMGSVSATATFTVTVGNAPTTPTVLYANTSAIGAQSGAINPTVLGSTSVVFSAIHNDPDGDAAIKYQLQIDDNDDFSSVLYDSENTGLVGTTLTPNANNGARSTNIAILPNGGAVTNNFSGGVPSLSVTYYWRIKFWDTNNNAGAFSASGTGAAYFVVPGVSCVNPPSNLTSWWSGDSNTTDRQGANSGQLSGGATFANGKVLRGFSFDGTDDAVIATDTGLPSGTQDRTVIGWLKTASTGEKYFFSYGTDSPTQAFGFGVLNNKLTVTQSGSSVSSTASVNDNTFHHVAVTYQATGNTYTLYIDGVQDGSGSMSTATTLSGSLYLGRYVTATNFIAGVLDEAAIFNRALSSSEINAIYQASASGMCKAPTGVVSISSIPTTQQTSTAGNQTISFTTPSGVPEDSSITLTFPVGFNISSLTEDDIDIQDDGTHLTTAANCSGTEDASISISGQVLTLTVCNGDGGAIAKNSVLTFKIGTNATQSGTGANQITNPSTTGSYTLSIGGTFGDVGSVVMPIPDSGQVGVSGSVPPSITFDIDSALTDGESASPYTVTLGTLSSSTLTTSNGTSINSIFLDLSSNASNGTVIKVFGANGGLYSTAKNKLITAVDEQTITAGEEKFGLCVASITQSSGAGTFSAGSTYDANGASNCTTANGGTPRVGQINTGPTTIASTNGTINGGRVQILAKAAVSTITPASTDYQEILTFIATGTF